VLNCCRKAQRKEPRKRVVSNGITKAGGFSDGGGRGTSHPQREGGESISLRLRGPAGKGNLWEGTPEKWESVSKGVKPAARKN